MKIAEGILNAYPKTYEEYVDTKLVGKDGINKLTGKDRDFYLNNPNIKEQYDRELNRRSMQVVASQLQEEGSSLYNAVARFKNEFKQLGAMGLAALDGPGGRFTIKELYDEGDGILGRVAPKLNMNKVREMLGGDPTPEQLRYIEDFYNKNSLASQTGLAAALLTEFIPVTGAGKGIAKGVGKTASNLSSDIKYGDTSFSATRGVSPKPTSGVGADVVKNIDELIKSKKPERDISYFTNKTAATKKIIMDALEANPGANRAELARITGVSETRVNDLLGPAAKVELGDAQNLVASKVDFNLSRDENIEAIKKLKLKSKKGFLTDDVIKRYVNRTLTAEKQLPVDDYSQIYRGMYSDRKYDPTEFGENWNDPLNIISKSDGSNKLSNYNIPNQELAKQKVAAEIADELFIPIEQARELLQKRISSNTSYRKKNKRLKELKANRGTPEGDLAWAKYTAGLAERQSRYREKIRLAVKNLPLEEKILREQQRIYAKYINNLTVNNENLQKSILNNSKFIEKISITVDPKTGTISPKKIDFKSLFNKNTDSRLFEIDHIKSVETNIAGLEFPANRQLILQPLHRNFKQPAVDFIEKLNSKVLNGKNLTDVEIKNVKNIITKAEELGVSMQPDVAEGFLKNFGVSGKIINPKPPGFSGVAAFKEVVEKNIPILKSMEEYKILDRERFVTPGLVGDDEEKRISDRFTGLSFGFGNIRELQQDIKDLYDDKLSDRIDPIREATEIKVADVLKDTRTVLNKGDRPIEVRPLTEGYKLFTESPIVRSIVAAPATGQIMALETVKSIYNNLRKGTENDIQMEEYFPAVYGLRQFLTQSVGKTPDEQTYISFIDEVNRAQETGFTRLGYNIVDLASTAPDWAFGTEATDKIKKSYDKMIEEGRITEPETFLGEVGAIGVEFGVPGGSVFKGVNLLRRMLKSKGLNLFATPTYSLTGGALLGAKISNVAKRVGTTAAVFGTTDFIAGGPYNTVSEVFGDDPLLFDNTLGYDYENTEGLSGKELSVANFKNRLRFGADGAIIGGLFPLVGPPLWYVTKNGLLKPGAAVASKTLQLGNELAVKPLSYLASGTLKAPFSAAGKLEVEVPGLREVSQGLAGGTKIFANFLGKDIITRATVAAMGAKPGLIKQLPDFKDWRMFEVNDADPLKANLKKIDKIFEFFREAGARSPDQLYLDVKTQNFIKSKSRQIEKILDSIEKKAYDLANGFLKRYNTNKTSPAGQDYLLDQVLSYIKGQIKLSDLPPELQSMSKALSEEFDSVRNFYKDVLPDDSGLKQFLTSNLKSYIRQSFGVFTNPQFKVDPKIKEQAIDFVVDRIRNNESLVELAIKNSTENTDVAIRNFARQQVDDLLATVKTEGFDPIIQLQKIAKENLKLDDVYVQTGEELPDVIRKLLGEEKGLRSSVMQTTASLVTQAANLKNYDRIGELLLQQGRLFVSRDEAIRAGVVNPVSVGRVPGLGLLDSGITQLYGSKEVTGMLRGSLGQLDKFMESSIYQSMIAYKAGVQTGKTVLSPATQTRNFGSAAAFVLNNGWIGGAASVTDAIKITLDDIFGAGRTFNEEELIKNITRKSELGVIDENIVASELSAVLADIKSGKVGTFGKLAGAADNSKLMKTATRLYSGGDNVWKWYGHEYLKSQLKGAFKNINEVKKAVRDDFGITEFNPKNMYEAVEEYAGMLVRELMPTYSKVPPMIQAIRKIPFIGNFVSFPAEIIRTSFATSVLAMKHIASDNPTLRAMGYRSLMGQAATLWALNEGARGLGYAMTNITPEQIRTYKDEFAADYMKYSDLIPISNLDKDKGTFKVFDMSRYNPYDLISSTVNNLIVRSTDPKTKLDPARIETDVLSEYFGASGPLLDLLNGTLFGLSIGTEGVYEALTGKTKTGSSVWSDSDTALEKFDKGIMHILNKNEPGVISSAQRVTAALAGDVSGTGQPIEIGDEAFKLIGGSTVTVDVPGSFAFKISEFQNTFKEPKVSEGWYSTKNYQQRGPAQLVREYNDMNEEAFREQYRFYRAVKSALDSGLMTESQIITALSDRKIPASTIGAILTGRYKPLSYGKGGLMARYKKIANANPNKKFNIQDFLPLGELQEAKAKWSMKRFEDFEIERKEPEQVSRAPVTPTQTQTAQPNMPVPTLPDTGTPVVAPNQMANVSGTAVSPQTGLTNSESIYLSPTEQLYRRKERGLA
jgi:hypothetical protein|tara:strand:+ start:363 stop:6917 length:6555 start_codon:yes stop_codon:yes gene_type:complete